MVGTSNLGSWDGHWQLGCLYTYIYMYIYMYMYIYICIYIYSISHIITYPLQFKYRISKQIYGCSFIPAYEYIPVIIGWSGKITPSYWIPSFDIFDTCPEIRHMRHPNKKQQTHPSKNKVLTSLPFKHPKNQAFVFISSKHSHFNIHPKNPKNQDKPGVI